MQSSPDSFTSYRVWMCGLTLVLAGLLWLTGPASTHGDETRWLTTHYPDRITAGPDGSMWFVEDAPLIGKITPAGDVTEFPLPAGVIRAHHIVAGPDGALWFTLQGRAALGRMTTDGAFSEKPLPSGFGIAGGITRGPDGLLWFTSYSGWRIGRLNADSSISEFPVADASVLGAITTGPDGNLWFLETWYSRVGRMTPVGTVTHFAMPTWTSPSPRDIAADSTGYIWYTVPLFDIVGRVSVDGAITEYTYDDPIGITQASDGSMCFTQGAEHCVTCITSRGAEIHLPLPADAWPRHLATGPDGNLWITGSKQIYMLPPPRQLMRIYLPLSMRG